MVLSAELVSAIEARVFGVGATSVRACRNRSGVSQASTILPRCAPGSNGWSTFDRLAANETRLSIATTDLETGDAVIFDTGRSDRIGIGHLWRRAASCPSLLRSRSTPAFSVTAGYRRMRR
jgi:hypothetical protein